MLDAIAPTPERLRRDTYEAPDYSPSTKREAYRVLDPWETLHRKGDIEEDQLAAGRRFEHHYQGMLGADARWIDEPRDDDPKRPKEFAAVVHGRAINAARNALTARGFTALEMLVTATSDVRNVGSALCGHKRPEPARAAGVALVQEALTVLSELWGYQTRPPSR